MKLIETKTLASAQTGVEFTSIPQTFTDLIVTISARSAVAGGGVRVRFNGTTTNYSERLLYGQGSGNGLTANTNSQTGFVWILSNLVTSTSNTFSNCQIYIPNYAGSTNKSISAESVTENNATAADIYIDAGLWSNTAAITSIDLTNPDGNLSIGTTFSLYGVLKGSDGTTVVS